jgi:hypothetical protein
MPTTNKYETVLRKISKTRSLKPTQDLPSDIRHDPKFRQAAVSLLKPLPKKSDAICECPGDDKYSCEHSKVELKEIQTLYSNLIRLNILSKYKYPFIGYFFVEKLTPNEISDTEDYKELKQKSISLPVRHGIFLDMQYHRITPPEGPVFTSEIIYENGMPSFKNQNKYGFIRNGRLLNAILVLQINDRIALLQSTSPNSMGKYKVKAPGGGVELMEMAGCENNWRMGLFNAAFREFREEMFNNECPFDPFSLKRNFSSFSVINTYINVEDNMERFPQDEINKDTVLTATIYVNVHTKNFKFHEWSAGRGEVVQGIANIGPFQAEESIADKWKPTWVHVDELKSKSCMFTRINPFMCNREEFQL